MMVSLSTALAGCVLTLILSAPSAKASSGQITFSGAVVEPTCSTTDADVHASLFTNNVPSSQSGGCDGANTLADAGPAYAQAVVRLDAADTADDPLLHYFAGYLNAAGVDGSQAKLVMRTYE